MQWDGVWSLVRIKIPMPLSMAKRFLKNQINKMLKKNIKKESIWYFMYHKAFILWSQNYCPASHHLYPLFPGILKHIPETSAYYVPGTQISTFFFLFLAPTRNRFSQGPAQVSLLWKCFLIRPENKYFFHCVIFNICIYILNPGIMYIQKNAQIWEVYNWMTLKMRLPV